MEHRFQVPSHQRNYDWDDDKITQLLDDIEGAMDREDNFYFIGLMVFMRTADGRLIVLDGQQRLATAVILFSAIRNWFAPIDPDSAARVQRDFIGASEYGQKDILPKLNLNYYNDQIFQQYIVAAKHRDELKRIADVSKKNDPNKQILTASLIFNDAIKGIAARLGQEAARDFLVKLVIYIRDHVMVVQLTVPDEASAFRVFETLNDRGQELSPMDLVKNHLFGLTATQSEGSLRTIETRWAQLMNTLANHKADDFLKVYWTSRHGRIQVSDLFPDVKRHSKSPDQAQDLSVDMLEGAEHYAALETADDPVWAKFNPAVRRSVRSLKLIGSKQARPVVLAALKKFGPHEMERLLRLLEIVVVRYQLIGGERTGALEISCAKLAKGIFDGEVTTATTAKGVIADVYPTDDDFQAAFATKQETNNQKAQYLLRGLEEERRRQAHGKMAGEEALGDALTIEHILPRSPSDEWAAVVDKDPDIAEDCASMLGNLCLLTKVNQTLGRLPYPEKRKIFAQSGIMLTNEAGAYESWSRQAIKHRQAAMAKLAVSAWRFQ
jgi:hypothetical protein